MLDIFRHQKCFVEKLPPIQQMTGSDCTMINHACVCSASDVIRNRVHHYISRRNLTTSTYLTFTQQTPPLSPMSSDKRNRINVGSMQIFRLELRTYTIDKVDEKCFFIDFQLPRPTKYLHSPKNSPVDSGQWTVNNEQWTVDYYKQFPMSIYRQITFYQDPCISYEQS